ncbi:hypothetical protein [Pseudorhodoplanes sinuspersici]|uniref:Uncharacterized protein n=1 Tax=Pseudorhodoplanes sinuspersici TaxID=1235591 RepID=A0A1W6ZYT5_9HYPH|nr:hypothetical protein [Pseudorhodoplanes sinuspersici]ARQ02542.1 hypothetical protein CAK95_28090 [Pseudorhodoplanes sinuspersici]RKE74390.1 hypothetical protein DFP91_2299 [Pseudorhodoplanes sinuspersici]
MRQFVLAIATAFIVALGLFGAGRAEAAPIGAAGALRTATDNLNLAEPVQYAGGRCWRNGWRGPGWYPCWHPGVVYGGGSWGWHNRYAWHGNWHDHYSWRWHDGGRRGWHGHDGRRRHAGGRHGGGRHAHASGHRGGRHGGGHRGGHHGGGHHGGGHRR